MAAAMKCVILAGGLGTRLAEETELRPKPMIEIGGRPILWHIMKHFAHYGVREFYIALGYKGEVIKRYFVEYYTLSNDLTIDLRSGAVTPHHRDAEDWNVPGQVFGAMGGGRFPLIGWGKPTPVNPLRWRNKDLANVMVSIAGILANLLIALIAFVIFKYLLMSGLIDQMSDSTQEPVILFLDNLLIMNISLAVFNLLPFPPLDGSKVLETFLPAEMQPALEFLERYGYFLLILLIYMGVFTAIIRPIINFVHYLLLLGVR